MWVVSLDDSSATDRVADAIRRMPRGSPLDVMRWIDLSDFYVKTVGFLSGQLGVMRMFIGLIVVLGVSNMLIMNVLETHRRGRDATGARRSSAQRGRCCSSSRAYISD